MLWRIAAKGAFGLIGAAQIVIGVYFLGHALAVALGSLLGVAGGYAAAGAVMVFPALVWAAIKTLARPDPGPSLGWSQILRDAGFVLSEKRTWRVLGKASAVIANLLNDR